MSTSYTEVDIFYYSKKRYMYNIFEYIAMGFGWSVMVVAGTFALVEGFKLIKDYRRNRHALERTNR